jgi:hypothetical protein
MTKDQGPRGRKQQALAVEIENPQSASCNYVLTLRPLPHDVPAVIRLRRGLKYLLRQCSLRCTAIKAEPGSGKLKNEK